MEHIDVLDMQNEAIQYIHQNNPDIELTYPIVSKAGQKIIITNTYFNPVVLEVEMADHDFDTLAIGLYGNQTKSIEDGIYTMYDLSGVNNIYKQYNLFEIRDQFDEQLFEVRQDRGNQIDYSKQFGTIIS